MKALYNYFLEKTIIFYKKYKLFNTLDDVLHNGIKIAYYSLYIEMEFNMRVTNQLFFHNTRNDYKNSMNMLYQTNQQFNGLKIQHSFQNTSMYVDAMRLDYEASALMQVKETSAKAESFANNTDKAFNQFSSSLDQFKTKLIQASNEGAMSTASLEAIANDLEGIRTHLINVANTSINGTFLFSGTATNIKPIAADGSYKGNDGSIKAVVGSGIELPYNIDGYSLFLGSSSDYQKHLTTNVPMFNQTKLHPEYMKDNPGELSEEIYITAKDSIRDMIGDSDANPDNDPLTVFYISGQDSFGNSVKKKVEMTSDAPISDLLEKIGDAFGNTSTNKIVDVSLNGRGQIEVKDLRKGSNQLEFHMFGAIDREAGKNSAGNANVDKIDELFLNPNVDIIEFNKNNLKGNNTITTISSNERLYSPGVFNMGFPLTNNDGKEATNSTTLHSIMGEIDEISLNGVDSSGNPITATLAVSNTTTLKDLTDEIKNSFGVEARVENGQIVVVDESLANGSKYGDSSFSLSLTTREGGSDVAGFSSPSSMNYDRNDFEKVGSKLKGNAYQIVNESGNFATSKDTLSSVAGINNIDGKTLVMDVVDINGNSKKVEINLADPKSTFSVDDGVSVETFDIFSAKGTDTAAKDVTYRQLMDVMGMVISDTLPKDDDLSGTIDADEYSAAVKSSGYRVEVNLDPKGRFEIIDRTSSVSKMELSIYDEDSGDFSKDGSLRFMQNSSLIIDEPSLNIFEDLEKIIEAVRTGSFFADGESGNPESIGIQNSIERLDHIMDHFTRSHTKIGTLSNSLKDTKERSELLIVNVNSVKSEIIDTDFGEAMIQFQQLAMSYQAMLSSVSRINSLSLVNFL